MTNSLKLLLFGLESCRPERVDEILEMARDKNVPLTDVAVEIVKTMLERFIIIRQIDSMPPRSSGRWESMLGIYD
jgi:hypothetical protein